MQRGEILLPYQRAWIDNDATHSIYMKSRRIGVTWAEALWSVRRRLTHRIDHIFVSTNEKTAAEFIRYCLIWASVLNLILGHEAIDLAGATSQSLVFPNGSRIIAVSSNPTALRGLGGDLTWDEAAWHDHAEDLYVACQPVVQWGGVLRIISTPAGPGTVFSRLFNDAQKNGYTPFRTTLVDAVHQGLARKVPGRHQQFLPDREACESQFLTQIKRTCLSEAAYRQEYLCEDVAAETIITPDQYDACLLSGFAVPDELDAKTKYGPLYLGIDVARAVGGNLTVVWAVERGEDDKAPDHLRECYRTVAVKTLQGVPFAVQSEVISRFLEHRSIHKACIDATGLGVGLSDDLVAKYGARVQPVQITRPTKAVLVERVARHVYQQRVSLPDEQAAREDICAMRRVPLTGGGFSYDGSSGASHCDRYMALALALQAAEQPVFRVLAGTMKGEDAQEGK